MFKDRKDAGGRLAGPLGHLTGANTRVLAIPKGGIPVGTQVALRLDVPFSVLVTRKLPFPHNPESGFGAVAEDGTVYVLDAARAGLAEDTVHQLIEQQRLEIQRRIDVLRDGLPLPELRGKTAVLVDDGIAMGSTMTASVRACQNMAAAHVVVAAPTAAPRAVENLGREADEVVVLESPPGFRAVADAYTEWHDVTDNEAIQTLRDYQEARADPAAQTRTK